MKYKVDKQLILESLTPQQMQELKAMYPQRSTAGKIAQAAIPLGIIGSGVYAANGLVNDLGETLKPVSQG